ncbi:MAG TPA: helix-hairpin-helix domain-containing protein [Bacteroidota bacterium]|nr:helix-hairpin-helix domain-containing protein [Bacteroidota bacterium]
MRKIVDVSILLICTAEFLPAQHGTVVDTLVLPHAVEEEWLLENSEDERGVLADEFNWLRDHPINLCTATAEELQRIPGISHLLAENIVARRRQQQFHSVAELFNVDGMTPEDYATLQRYVYADKNDNSCSVQYLTRSTSEIERREGYVENIYQGSPLKEYNRLTVSIYDTAGICSELTSLETGFLAEKDAGEPSLTDFTTWYVAGSIPKIRTNFILGDYLFSSGDGLVLNQSFFISKSSDVIASYKNNQSSIRPYRSTDENNFCRGIAVSTEWSTLQLQMMYSHREINAMVDSAGTISSLDASGLFRTPTEQSHRNSAGEQMLGGRFHWHPLPEWTIGATAYHSSFDHPFLNSANDTLTFQQLNVRGVDIAYTTTRTDLFSEIAFSEHASAWIGGVTAKPVSSLELSLVARNYSPEFLNLHSSAFGEHGNPAANEFGLYSAARIKFFSWMRLSMYYDQFRFPKFDPNTNMAGSGNDALGLMELRWNKQCELELYAKRKSTPDLCNAEDDFGRTIQQLDFRIQRNYRITVNYTSLRSAQFSTRIECVHVEEKLLAVNENGYLLSQSLQWKMFDHLRTYLQVTMYKTDSYNSRMYRYEDELPGAFTNAMLYGEGLRWYVLLQYEVGRNLQLYAKFSCSVKNGVSSLGSGWDEIPGNTLQQISMQMDVNL